MNSFVTTREIAIHITSPQVSLYNVDEAIFSTSQQKEKFIQAKKELTIAQSVNIIQSWLEKTDHYN